MGRVGYYRDYLKFMTRRDLVVLAEIGADSINSASGFVDYINETYGFSKSSVWYILNKLKERGLLDFATKEERGKSLSLTEEGIHGLQFIAGSNAVHSNVERMSVVNSVRIIV